MGCSALQRSRHSCEVQGGFADVSAAARLQSAGGEDGVGEHQGHGSSGGGCYASGRSRKHGSRRREAKRKQQLSQGTHKWLSPLPSPAPAQQHESH